MRHLFILNLGEISQIGKYDIISFLFLRLHMKLQRSTKFKTQSSKYKYCFNRIVKSLILIFILIGLPFNLVFGQNGGSGTYQFLDLTNSAKVAALGGTQIAMTDNDLSLTWYNPALLTDSMKNQLSVNYVSYIAGIGVGYAAFAPKLKGRNAFSAAIHYVNYGTFQGASETGQLTGTFKASEYAVNLFFSRKIASQLNVGINIKPIFSTLESYHSFGIASDLGIVYKSKDGHSVASFVTKNMGYQITTYYQNGVNEKLPWDLQLGFSRQFNNAPVKVFVTADHLNNWNLSYADLPSGQASSAPASDNFTTTLMRHLVLGAEFSPEQHVTLRFGYNYQRRKELEVESRPGMVGYSAGLGVKFSKFDINYGIASFHLAAAVHYFSLTTSLSEFLH